VPTKADRTAGPDVAILISMQPCGSRRDLAHTGFTLLSRPTWPVVTSRAAHAARRAQE